MAILFLTKKLERKRNFSVFQSFLFTALYKLSMHSNSGFDTWSFEHHKYMQADMKIEAMLLSLQNSCSKEAFYSAMKLLNIKMYTSL